MKIFKRVITLSLALLMVLGMAACGGGGNSGSIQIDFMYGGDAAVTEMYGLAIKQFNDTVGKQEGITIKGIPKSSSINTVLSQQLPAGTGPDVMALADDYFKRYTKYFVDLTDVLTKAEHDDFYDTIISRYHYNIDTTTSNATDPLYAVPAFNDATVLYYNKTVLEANGVICISVEAKDLEAFNAGTLKDGNGKTKADYGITVTVPEKGYYRSGSPFVPGADEHDGSSWMFPGNNEVLIFNDRIAMNWDEIEDLAMLCTKSKNADSKSKYGYYSEWWFNYGWSVGGDCMEDLTGNGDWTYSLPANNPNYIVTKGTYTGIYTGTVYNVGDTLDFKDVLVAEKGATISYKADNSSFNYTVNGQTATFRDFKTEIANGTLAKLPSIKDAFSRFVYLSAVGGMNVCPYPNQFNGTTAAQYFAGGDMALLVEKISNFGNIGKIMKDTWSVAPMPQYKEYTNPSDPSCDDVKVLGKTAGHSLGYSLAINNDAKIDSRIKDAAKVFVKWFATDGQAFLATKGYASSRKSDAQASITGLAAKYNNPEVILTSVQNASAGDWWYMTDNNWITTWSNPLNNEVRYGKKSLEDFLYAYIEATNNALATYK